MSDSILISTKLALGLEADDPSFDTELTMLINSAFLDLSQIGVGPAAGFMIENAAATWEQLLGEDSNLNAAKTLVHLKVRILFDPPATGPLMTAVEKQIERLEWRLNVHRETTEWQPIEVRTPREDVFGDPVTVDGGVG